MCIFVRKRVEAAATKLALMRLGVGVNIQVLLEMSLHSKAFFAVLTLEGFLFIRGVNVNDMILEDIPRGAHLAANLARKLLLVTVHVPKERLGMLEYFSTCLTRALISAMGFLHVKLKKFEGLSTFFTELGFQPNGLVTSLSEMWKKGKQT